MSTTVRAAYIDRFGPSDVIQLGDLHLSAADDDEVTVAVRHSAVNPVDLGTREGRVIPREAATFPMTLGWDAEGEVTAVGSNVTDLAVGDYVYMVTPQAVTGVGSHVDGITIDAGKVALTPRGWAGGAAAALGLAGITAFQAVQATGLRAGDRLLINNPVGFVGWLATQIAVAQDLHVSVATDAAGAMLARELEVETLDAEQLFTNAQSTTGNTATSGLFDGAIDLLGGPRARATFGQVRDGGAYATVIAEWWIGGGQYLSARGITPRVVENNPNRRDLDALSALADNEQLRVRIAEHLPLSRLSQAHDLLAQPGVLGKIIIDH